MENDEGDLQHDAPPGFVAEIDKNELSSFQVFSIKCLRQLIQLSVYYFIFIKYMKQFERLAGSSLRPKSARCSIVYCFTACTLRSLIKLLKFVFTTQLKCTNNNIIIHRKTWVYFLMVWSDSVNNRHSPLYHFPFFCTKFFFLCNCRMLDEGLLVWFTRPFGGKNS